MKKLLVVGLLASGSCVYASENEAPGITVQNKGDIFTQFGQLSLTRNAAVAAHAQAKQVSKQSKTEADLLHEEYKKLNQQAKDALERALAAKKNHKKAEQEEAKAHQESRQARKARNEEVARFNAAAEAHNKECYTRLSTYSLEQEEAVSEDEKDLFEEAAANTTRTEKDTYAGKAKGKSKANQTHNK